MRKIVQRVQQPTPRFFRKMRNFALLLTGITGAITAAPVALPALLVTIAGYAAVAGAIAGAVCQTAVVNEESH